jgi:hypothetical protein
VINYAERNKVRTTETHKRIVIRGTKDKSKERKKSSTNEVKEKGETEKEGKQGTEE